MVAHTDVSHSGHVKSVAYRGDGGRRTYGGVLSFSKHARRLVGEFSSSELIIIRSSIVCFPFAAEARFAPSNVVTGPL